MENLIACLYPLDGKGGYATRAVGMPENSSRYLAAEIGLPDKPGCNSRESTPPPDENNNTNTKRGEGLQLTFTYGPKTGPGFVLGCDRNSCDIVLPALVGISRRHCYLTFDAQRRLIVTDCSKNGTIVEYDSKGGERRRHFTWIIGGHAVLDNTNQIIVQLHSKLRFLVVVSKPLHLDLYLANVDNFLQETATSRSLSLSALGIQSSASTATPSGTHTLNQDPILLEQGELGEGSFSKVLRVCDVSTGMEYASKRFHDVQKSDWRKEASLMRQISHEHMVLLSFVIESPQPQLILEYLPLGNLDQQHFRQSLSKHEVRVALVQGLSALNYLHGKTPQIVHRDIKPENLLVLTRDPLHIKLGDFGLSKESEDLETLCGTRTYLAPEVARYYYSRLPLDYQYTRAVDIWSFGVVIFQYACGLPSPGAGGGLRWCQKIVERLNDQKSDDLIDILSNMVAMDAQTRHSAEECLEKALKLESPSRSSTPKVGTYRSLQAGLASPAEKISTCELYGIQDSRSKRQRSPAGNSDENYRTMKSFSHVHSVSSMSVLRLLIGIQHEGDDDGDDYGHLETLKFASIYTLCQQLERLKITELKKHADSTAERIIITGVFQAHEFILANFTSSDCANSVADLAQRLTVKISYTLEITERHREPECVKTMENSVEDYTGSPTATTRKPCDINHTDKANKDDSLRTTNSTRSRSIVSDPVHPLNFPSALLDLMNISGCAPLTSY